VALLQRLYRAGVRAAALPAGGGPRVLLRRSQVPLSVRLTRREDGEVSPGDVRAPRRGTGRRLLATDRAARWQARGAARRGGRGADAVRVSRGRGGRGVAVAPGTVRREHPLRRSRSSG